MANNERRRRRRRLDHPVGWVPPYLSAPPVPGAPAPPATDITYVPGGPEFMPPPGTSSYPPLPEPPVLPPQPQPAFVPPTTYPDPSTWPGMGDRPTPPAPPTAAEIEAAGQISTADMIGASLDADVDAAKSRRSNLRQNPYTGQILDWVATQGVAPRTPWVGLPPTPQAPAPQAPAPQAPAPQAPAPQDVSTRSRIGMKGPVPRSIDLVQEAVERGPMPHATGLIPGSAERAVGQGQVGPMRPQSRSEVDELRRQRGLPTLTSEIEERRLRLEQNEAHARARDLARREGRVVRVGKPWTTSREIFQHEAPEQYQAAVEDKKSRRELKDLRREARRQGISPEELRRRRGIVSESEARAGAIGASVGEAERLARIAAEGQGLDRDLQRDLANAGMGHDAAMQAARIASTEDISAEALLAAQRNFNTSAKHQEALLNLKRGELNQQTVTAAVGVLLGGELTSADQLAALASMVGTGVLPEDAMAIVMAVDGGQIDRVRVADMILSTRQSAAPQGGAPTAPQGGAPAAPQDGAPLITFRQAPDARDPLAHVTHDPVIPPRDNWKPLGPDAQGRLDEHVRSEYEAGEARELQYIFDQINQNVQKRATLGETLDADRHADFDEGSILDLADEIEVLFDMQHAFQNYGEVARIAQMYLDSIPGNQGPGTWSYEHLKGKDNISYNGMTKARQLLEYLAAPGADASWSGNHPAILRFHNTRREASGEGRSFTDKSYKGLGPRYASFSPNEARRALYAAAGATRPYARTQAEEDRSRARQWQQSDINVVGRRPK